MLASIADAPAFCASIVIGGGRANLPASGNAEIDDTPTNGRAATDRISPRAAPSLGTTTVTWRTPRPCSSGRLFIDTA